MSILAVDGDGRRASLWCNPETGGLYVTTDPDDVTAVPPWAVLAAAFRTDHKGRLILSDEAPPFEWLRNELFGNGEQGIYMPSVHESFLRGDLYQDAAGTTPAALGQPVGLWLDRSRGLELGPELVTNGDFSDGTTGWTSDDATLSIVGTSLRVVTTGDYGRAVQGISLVAGKTYVYEADIESVSGNTQNSIQITTNPNGGGAPLAADAGVGSRHAHLVYTATSTGVVYVTLQNNHSQPSTHDFSNVTFREIPGNHASQPTAASRPTLQQDANGIYCLRFDGVDDGMVTPSVDFTGTDKMTVLAGVYKASDAAPAPIMETTPYLEPPRVALMAPRNGGAPNYGLQAGAPVIVDTNTGPNFPAPNRAVLSAAADVPGKTQLLRANTVTSNNSGDMGTGSFGERAINIGARPGNIYFTGDIYGLIVCGAKKSLAQIEYAEALINRYTRAF